jgi:nicotinamidase-related amidase
MDKFSLNKDDVAIVLVDIQDRLASVMADKLQVISNCLHLIELSKLLNIPVIMTEQYPKGLGHTVPEIREALPDHKAIEKLTFDCCGVTSFLDDLASFGKKNIVLVGMESHICVLQTCIGLIKKGYTVHVTKDAVCSRTKENFKTGIGFMRDAGAVITCTETVLFQLLEKAGTEEFRTISKRIQ